MDGEAWKAAVHGVAEGWAWLSYFTYTFHIHALEKEMAAHSSFLAWRIPGMGEPGGLPSMGSQRVGHDWSDLAATLFVRDRRMMHWDDILPKVIFPGGGSSWCENPSLYSRGWAACCLSSGSHCSRLSKMLGFGCKADLQNGFIYPICQLMILGEYFQSLSIKGITYLVWW